MDAVRRQALRLEFSSIFLFKRGDFFGFNYKAAGLTVQQEGSKRAKRLKAD